MEEIGQPPGTEPLELLYLPSLTGCKSLPATENISSTFSPSHIPASTTESSPLIKQCANELEASEILSYPISKSLPILRSRTWTPLESQLSQEDLKKMEDKEADEERIGRKTNLVINGMKGNAVKQKRNAE